MFFASVAEKALDVNLVVMHRIGWGGLVLMPLGFAALRWLTIRHAAQARGSGIPQVIAAMDMPSRSDQQRLLVSLPQAIWKIILTAGGLVIGASIGREGPSVQVGAAVMLAWGAWWHDKTRAKRRVRIGFRTDALMAAGAAGGLAAAFNTPLAGVVFAIEELGRGSVVRFDRLVMSGVLTAGFLTLALIGNNPYFHIEQNFLALTSDWSGVLLAGAVNGVLGGLFASLLLRGAPGMVPYGWRQHIQQHPIVLAALCGLLAALLGLVTHGSTYGTGYPQASSLLNGHESGTPWFGIAKLASTVLAYVAGLPGGIFTPSLAVGAGIGEHLSALFPGHIAPGLLALLSMAGFLAAATQAPITATVITMEMTRSHDLTLMLLAVTLLASFVSRQFCPRPFYHSASRNFRREAVAVARDRQRASPETRA
ncbi:chloride channel protein [Noviherbaspirillum sp. 17J57-3]|uniref:Chloride channel protein n=2 Tax=Noviherbaspirillum galbum TaxID=2709383 RepID=A0A6B3SQE6_9BURK|nr:chloride channel protein [Noviherbaspirillum galbum]